MIFGYWTNGIFKLIVKLVGIKDRHVGNKKLPKRSHGGTRTSSIEHFQFQKKFHIEVNVSTKFEKK